VCKTVKRDLPVFMMTHILINISISIGICKGKLRFGRSSRVPTCGRMIIKQHTEIITTNPIETTMFIDMVLLLLFSEQLLSSDRLFPRVKKVSQLLDYTILGL
jgi:hypothetical protein